ncbi:hypothetical protein COU37_02605 [Candidatus Micrarchaeota archaeon CG10_big_fil_rev_8_21_14_0_10_45_29]|nr:MAG: hypothetical protein COU37_02605 [Candidatus Micrarchaeota archaeon CG10_big_fil_rev_8_21_14_0_10_45_29]
MDRKERIEKIKQILKKHKIKKAYFFGSFARKEKNYKDIDIAIRPPKNFSIIDMAGVQIELEEAVSKKIDLVSLRAIRPAFKPYIKKDLAAII